MGRLLDAIAANLRHLGDRQKVIAGNIANADTPGFKARTLAEPDFARLLDGSGPGSVRGPAVQATEAMVRLGHERRSGARPTLDRSVSETKPDGNNVTLEQQLLAMGQVQADYAILSSLYRKQLGLIRSALGGRSG